MFVVTRECGPVLTNGYLLGDDNGNAVIIDAPMGIWDLFEPIIKEKQLTLRAILLTHTHWDHTIDSYRITEQSNALVYVHSLDAFRLLEPNLHTVYKLPFKIQPVSNFIYVNDGDLLKFGEIKLRVIHTPGHTEGGVCYVDEENRLIFTGDTIFSGSVGRTDLPGGESKQLLDTIRTKIISLPLDYNIYSGHGPATTINKEVQSNPFIN